MPEQVFARKVKKGRFIHDYLLILNGLMRLTKKELLFLEHGIITMEDDGVLYGDGVIRFNIRKDLKISGYGFNNLLMSLKRKTVIFKGEHGCYMLNPKLMFNTIRKPKSLSLVFKIEIDNENTTKV